MKDMMKGKIPLSFERKLMDVRILLFLTVLKVGVRET